ncbi:MAG: pyridoxamine 5'-phosphate oxidase [Ferruginibacter sp.]|nr:pyridoxamine 5'-phosphate oxidase [Ferruginibacter sp.]
MSVADIRTEYKKQSLNKADILSNAFEQFTKWWNEALQSELDEVNAMTLATVAPEGTPAARIVLLKGFDERGFVFYTNYNSNKGKQIDNSGKAALLFFWAPLERQIRITGTITKVSEEESDAYFNSRPVGSKIGAWASPQSLPIFDRSVIEDNEKKYQAEYTDENIPRPPHWGGYIVQPFEIEFWQGRPSRLHDRFLYTLQEGGSWKIERLAP